jgi:hypothetical protein
MAAAGQGGRTEKEPIWTHMYEFVNNSTICIFKPIQLSFSSRFSRRPPHPPCFGPACAAGLRLRKDIGKKSRFRTVTASKSAENDGFSGGLQFRWTLPTI